MDLLQAEMARKRKAFQLAKEQTRDGNNGKKKKQRQFLKTNQLKQFMEEQEEEGGAR